jgi:hypothetical protein
MRTQGTNNPMFGKHHLEEAKLVISSKNKGKVMSELSKNKMSESQRGRKHSTETKIKMSISAKRIWKSRKESHAN